MADFKDILSNEEEKLNDEELMKYLNGALSEEEKHAVEKKTADSDFLNDALEGLQEFKNKQQLDEHVRQLNKNLHQHLAEHRQKKEKRRLKDNPWALVALIIILGLCIVGYIVLQIYNKKKSASETPSKQTALAMVKV